MTLQSPGGKTYELGWILGAFAILTIVANIVLPHWLARNNEATRRMLEDQKANVEFRTNTIRDVREIHDHLAAIRKQLAEINAAWGEGLRGIDAALTRVREENNAAWQSIERNHPGEQRPRLHGRP